MSPFHPTANATVLIDVSSSNQRIKLVDVCGPISCRVMNDGTATVWITFGGSGATASTSTGMPVGPGAEKIITVDAPDSDAVYMAAIAAGSTGKVYFTPGRGGM